MRLVVQSIVISLSSDVIKKSLMLEKLFQYILMLAKLFL